MGHKMSGGCSLVSVPLLSFEPSPYAVSFSPTDEVGRPLLVDGLRTALSLSFFGCLTFVSVGVLISICYPHSHRSWAVYCHIPV